MLSKHLRGLVVSAASVAPFFAVAAPAEDGGIETIVVTAQKRVQDAQEVPISIEVVQGEALDAYQVRDFKSLQNYVPNLLIQSSPGNDAIFIRGFGSQAANYAFDQSVSLYQDGVYGGRNRQFMAPFFDVERVEVMRGPQGALLGKNTAAGALSIVTAGPTEEFDANLTTSYNFDREGVDAYGHISGPLNDEWSGRLALKYTDIDGYISNDAIDENNPGLENYLVRGSLRYEPSDTLDVTAKLEYADFTTDGTNTVRVSPVNADLDDTKSASSPFGQPETDDEDAVNGSVTANFDWGDHTLTSITGYSDFNDDKFVGGGAGSPENWLSTFHEDFDQISQEVRLLSPTDRRFEYIVGAYWDSADYRQYNGSRYENFLGLAFFDGQIHHVFKQESETWSVFSIGTWHFTDRLRVSGSARYTWNSKDGDFDQFSDFGVPLSPPKSLSDDIDETNLDPSITLQYDVNDGVMLYASYGAGSKAGGFVAQRAATQSTFTFDEETSENLEVGVKATLFDRRLLFNVTLYETTFEDLQVSFFVPTIPGFITGNAAEATSSGFEAAVLWQIVPQLQVGASLAYLDAEYDDFPGAACLAPPLSPPGCTPATNNLEGTTLPGASDWTGNVHATFVQPIGAELTLEIGVIAYVRSEFTTASDSSPTYGEQDDYEKVDARIEVSGTDERWGLALVGKNLTDEYTQGFSYLWPIAPPPVGIQFLDETRTVALEFRFNF